MLLIALTGGIGSGKTTVSDIFKSKNIPVIDTDIIARQIVEKDKPAYNEIIKLYGKEILNDDKTINRQTLRDIIFSSEKKRLQLENILHPVIWHEVNQQLKIIKEKSTIPAYCIIVVPLLFENLEKIINITFDRILVIDVEEEVQISRAKKRDGCNDITVKNIMDNQVSRQVRVDAADDVILNSKDINALKIEVENLNNKYIELSK